MKITAVYTDQVLREHGIDPHRLTEQFQKHKDKMTPVFQNFGYPRILGKALKIEYDDYAKHFIIAMDLEFDIGIGGIGQTARDVMDTTEVKDFQLHEIPLIAIPKPEEKENVEKDNSNKI